MKKVSVIIPTFNERENIVPLVRAVHGELRDVPHEILVVDDQSPDGTAQVVMDLKDPGVRVFVRDHDRGYARSIREGIERSTGDLLIVMDSDFNHDPQCIPDMVRRLADYDCVSGSRFLSGGKMTPAWRGVASGIFNAFVRRMTGGKITDNLFGLFGLRRTALQGLPFDEIFQGFGDYGMRLLYYLQKNNARILEFPSVCGKRLAGRGNRNYFRTLIRYIQTVCALAGAGRIQ